MLGVLVAERHLPGELDLLLGREQGHLADLLEIHAHRVVGGEIVHQRVGVVEIAVRDLLDLGQILGLGHDLVERREQIVGADVDVDAALFERLIEFVDDLGVEVQLLEHLELLGRELARLLALLQQVVEALLRRLGRLGGVLVLLAGGLLRLGRLGDQLRLPGGGEQGVRHFAQFLFGVDRVFCHLYPSYPFVCLSRFCSSLRSVPPSRRSFLSRIFAM